MVQMGHDVVKRLGNAGDAVVLGTSVNHSYQYRVYCSLVVAVHSAMI